MSRKDPVTREMLFAAADEIVATGESPTLQKLRERVGGSFNTLTPLLNEWKAQQQQHTAVLLDMPDSVLTAMKTAGAEIWKSASDAAGERIRQVETNAVAKTETAETTVREYADEIARLESELKQAQTAAQDAVQREREVAGQVTSLEVAKASVESALKAKTAEADKTEERLDALQKRFDTLQQELLSLAKDTMKPPPNTKK